MLASRALRLVHATLQARPRTLLIDDWRLPYIPSSASVLIIHVIMHAHAIQVSQFLFGDGFAVSGGDQWRVRRKAVNPALHKAYLNTMIDRVFAPSALHLAEKLQVLPLLGHWISTHCTAAKTCTCSSAPSLGVNLETLHGCAPQCKGMQASAYHGDTHELSLSSRKLMSLLVQ